MNVTTDNIALVEIIQTHRATSKEYKKLPSEVIDGFIKVYRIFLREQRIEGLFKYGSLHYEKLKGTKIESVRINRKYRILFKSGAKEGEVIITEIELLDISKHYQ